MAAAPVQCVLAASLAPRSLPNPQKRRSEREQKTFYEHSRRHMNTSIHYRPLINTIASMWGIIL